MENQIRDVITPLEGPEKQIGSQVNRDVRPGQVAAAARHVGQEQGPVRSREVRVGQDLVGGVRPRVVQRQRGESVAGADLQPQPAAVSSRAKGELTSVFLVRVVRRQSAIHPPPLCYSLFLLWRDRSQGGAVLPFVVVGRHFRPGLRPVKRMDLLELAAGDVGPGQCAAQCQPRDTRRHRHRARTCRDKFTINEQLRALWPVVQRHQPPLARRPGDLR